MVAWLFFSAGVSHAEPQFVQSRSQKSPTPSAAVDRALSYAIEAAQPYVKQGFTIRQDFWGGVLKQGEPTAIVHQLFKGNEYWFWMGTDQKSAVISVHIYDGSGRLADTQSWKRSHMAAVRVVPKRTGTYYLIVEVEKSRSATPWAMAYGYR